MNNNEYNIKKANEVLYDIDYYIGDFTEPIKAEYNGWHNIDTWRFNLNLTNEYCFIKPLENEINKMSLKDFVIYCLTNVTYFVDKINFTEVNYKEVFQALKNN